MTSTAALLNECTLSEVIRLEGKGGLSVATELDHVLDAAAAPVALCLLERGVSLRLPMHLSFYSRCFTPRVTILVTRAP